MLRNPDFPGLPTRPWPRFSFARVFKDSCDHSVAPNHSFVTGTTAPPGMRCSAERNSRFDSTTGRALIPCISPGMMPTLISGSR
jgi:hypothetical protein